MNTKKIKRRQRNHQIMVKDTKVALKVVGHRRN